MANQITKAEGDAIAAAILGGKLAKGESVEVLAGVFVVGAIRREKGGIHVTLVQRLPIDHINVEFRVGGDNGP